MFCPSSPQTEAATIGLALSGLVGIDTQLRAIPMPATLALTHGVHVCGVGHRIPRFQLVHEVHHRVAFFLGSNLASGGDI